MTLHHLLIDLTAKTRNLTVPADLEAWLLDEYGWEAIDDLMEPSDLMDAIEMHCRQYHDGELDVTPRSEADLWKDRAETAKFLLQGLEAEKHHLIEESERLMRLLDDNGTRD